MLAKIDNKRVERHFTHQAQPCRIDAWTQSDSNSDVSGFEFRTELNKFVQCLQEAQTQNRKKKLLNWRRKEVYTC